MYPYIAGTLLTQLQILFTNNSLVRSHQTRHYWDPNIIARKKSNVARIFIHQSPKS